MIDEHDEYTKTDEYKQEMAINHWYNTTPNADEILLRIERSMKLKQMGIVK